MALGANLASPGTYSPNRPYINLVWSGGAWQRGSDQSYWPTQDQGLVTGNSGTALCMRLADNGEGLPTGTYTVYNPDGCSIGMGGFGTTPNYTSNAYTTATSFTFSYTAGNPLYLHTNGNITNTAGTALGGIAVCYLGEHTRWQAGEYFTQIFLDFIAALNPAHIRVMDWLNTNTSVVTDWADRTVMGKISFQSWYGGCPWEVLIAMANKLNKNIWGNIPPRATTAYSSSLGSLMTANLNSGLKFLCEYANEVSFNQSGAFAAPYQWVNHLTFTKWDASFNPVTGVFTKTAHGLSNNTEVRSFSSKNSRNTGFDDGYESGPTPLVEYWRITRGQPLYAQVIDANTYTLWTGLNGTGIKGLGPQAMGTVTLIHLRTDEAGKTASITTNYPTRALAHWTALDTTLSNTRSYAVLGSQGSGSDLTNSMAAAVPTAFTRANYLCIAPYFRGIMVAGAVDITSGTFQPKVWTNDTETATAYFGLYATGSTPTNSDVKTGAGTGFVAGTNRTWTQNYGNTGAAYVNSSSTVSSTNGTARLGILIVKDSLGYEWRIERTITASASASTQEYLDTQANQNKRCLIHMDHPTNTGYNLKQTITLHKGYAQAVNPSIQVVAYEGGNHQDESMPTDVNTWKETWMESAGYGAILKEYYYQQAASGMVLATYYQDVNASGPWSAADSYTDTTDARIVALGSFSGAVPIRTLVDFSTIDAGTISADPVTYPYTLYTFADATLTYEIVGGDDVGNYAMSGANVRMVAQTGVNWASPTQHTLKMRATDSYTEAFFDLGFFTGNGWYEAGSSFALDMTTQASAATLTPAVGNAMTRTGSGGTFSGGMLDGDNTASWAANPAWTGALSMANSILMCAVVDQDDLGTAGAATVVQFGNNPTFYFSMATTGTPTNIVQLSFFGNTGTVESFDINVTRPSGKFVIGIFYDPANSRVRMYFNQTLMLTQAMGNHSTETINPYVYMAQNTVKKGSIKVVPSLANDTAALASIQKVQTLHSIP